MERGHNRKGKTPVIEKGKQYMRLYEAFEKLPDEKREKIFQACMEVFAEKGYEGASTNDIVKKAGISKGILFHYFGNKKNLYMYVLDKTLDRAIDKITAGYRTSSADLFERITMTGILKLRLALEEPLVYKLIYVTFVNTPEALREDAQERYKKLYGIALPLLFDGLDMSKIRNGVDPDKAIEVVLFFMEGLQAKYLEAYRNMTPEQALSSLDKLTEDSFVYMDILRKGIYGTEHHL